MESPLSRGNLRPGPTSFHHLRSSDDYGDDGPYLDLEFFINSESENEVKTCRLSLSDYCLLPSDHVIINNKSVHNSNSKLTSLFKPAAKFRFFLLRFKNKHQQRQKTKKVNPEGVRVVSLFARTDSASSSPGTDDKEFKKDVIHKYLSKIKPLYVRVSKRYADKIRFSGPLTAGGVKECHCQSLPRPNYPNRLLRKSRSASSAIAPVVPSPPLPVIEEDGIQSAIAHCKNSFNSVKGSDASLFRSRSDPGGERSSELK